MHWTSYFTVLLNSKELPFPGHQTPPNSGHPQDVLIIWNHSTSKALIPNITVSLSFSIFHVFTTPPLTQASQRFLALWLAFYVYSVSLFPTLSYQTMCFDHLHNLPTNTLSSFAELLFHPPSSLGHDYSSHQSLKRLFCPSSQHFWALWRKNHNLAHGFHD